MKSIVALVCFAISSTAFAGGVTIRGGGDEVGLEFSDAVASARETIHHLLPELGVKVDAALARLNQVNVLVSDEPLKIPVDGKEQDSVASNEPSSGTIWIYRARWNKIRHPRLREAIALHEILSLVNEESTGHYPLSGAYLAYFHLRNDEIVFLTGSDPDMPAWKTRRKTCDYTHAGTTSTSFKAELVWSLNDTFYFMSYIFGPHRNASDVISLFQMQAKRVWSKGNLTLTEGNSGRAVGAFLGEALRSERNPKTTSLVEDLGNGHAIGWSVVNGGKGQKLSETQTSTMADGSEHSLATYANGDSEDCVTTDISGEQWLALTGRPQMGMEIENLNRLALLFYDADRVLKSCKKECRESEKTRSQALDRFNSAWDQIYKSK